MINLPLARSPRVSVVIVATSSPELLHACLRSVAGFAPSAIPFETIVVLNEAKSEAAAELRATVTGAQVVSSPVNLGLAGAGNRGRAVARGELLLLLHDDAEVEAGWMEALVQTADAHPEAGAVGGKVLYPDGRLQNAGMILWRDAYTSPPWVGEAPPSTAFDRLRAVDYCGSSSLLVRAAAWDAIGGLDERFYPVYYVDVDLSMSLRTVGFVVLYQPGSRIRHHRGASGNPHLRAFARSRNRVMFQEKWADALAEYEPPARGSPEAIRRAVSRAEAVAEGIRQGVLHAGDRLAAKRAFDVVDHERQSYERSHAFLKAYVGSLTKTIEEKEKDLARLRARLEPDYFMGDEIDFSDPILSRRFLVGGWGETESWGVWTIGPRADLRLRFKGDPGRAFILKALVDAFLSAAHPRVHVRVSAEGQPVADWVFDINDADRPRWRIATILARADDRREKPLEISFVIDAPAAPASLGLSADVRNLGLGLFRLAISPPSLPDANLTTRLSQDERSRV